jgi:hypothetical protein
MTNRQVQNIQKIARTKEIQKAIDELRATGQIDNFGEISGQRGRAFKDESFNSNNSSQNTTTRNAFAGSSPLSGDGTGAQIPVSSEQGSENADDFLDDESDLFTSNGGDEESLSGKQQLRELTGLEDCLTGDPFEVRFDGQYKPPATWDEANTPPGGEEDETWTSGVYYRNSATEGSATIFGASANIVLDAVLQNLIDSNPSFDYVETGRFPISFTMIGGEQVFNYQINYANLNPDGTVGGIGNGAAYAFTCSGSPPAGSSAACAVMSAPTTPVETEWPEDPSRPTYLSWNAETGKFEPNQYDPNVPPKYVDGMSELNLCTEDGKNMTIKPLRDGGFAIYESQSSGGPVAVDATIKKVNRNLTVEGIISEDELNFLLPR